MKCSGQLPRKLSVSGYDTILPKGSHSKSCVISGEFEMADKERRDMSDGMAALLAIGVLAVLIATGTLKKPLAWFGGVFWGWLWS